MYIDPGSTNFLIQIIIGGVAAAGLAIATFWRRIVSMFSRKKDTPAAPSSAAPASPAPSGPATSPSGPAVGDAPADPTRPAGTTDGTSNPE